MELTELRSRIDEADERLLAAFADRMRAARDIAEHKRRLGLPVTDAAREREVVARRVAAADPDIAMYIEPLYAALFEASRSYQQSLLSPRADGRNLVLVGMPGCGKSTIGRLLAASLAMPLADIDDDLEREAGASIPQLFETEGEQGFRAREAAVIARYADCRGLVIATGGGSVLAEINRERLRRNGFVVHLRREIDKLEIVGRPLSLDRAALEAMWLARAPLYAACADIEADNNGTLQACVRRVEAAYLAALRA